MSGGREAERKVADFLDAEGVPAFLPYNAGFEDEGDIHGVSPFVLQVKDYRDLLAAIRDGVAGALRQKVRADEPFGAAVVRRPGKGVGEWYVVLPLREFADVLRHLRSLM
jgi:hypothetical protein